MNNRGRTSPNDDGDRRVDALGRSETASNDLSRMLDVILARLVSESAFAPSLLSRERLASHLESRTQETRTSSVAAMAARALADREEFARIEALFSPPETWLFRYPESYEFLRQRIAHGEHGVYRVLIAGCGGWCEPVSVAIALLDGARGARRIEIDAVDRNPHVLDVEPRFSGLQVRGGIPSWAKPWFIESPMGVAPNAEVRSIIRLRTLDVAAAIERATYAAGQFDQESSLSAVRYDAVLFRNVAIYLDDAMRARIYRGIAKILAPDGVLLVGHAETFTAAEGTGFEQCAAPGAFALTPARLRSGVNAVPIASPLPAPNAGFAVRVDDSARPTTPPSSVVRPPAKDATERGAVRQKSADLQRARMKSPTSAKPEGDFKGEIGTHSDTTSKSPSLASSSPSPASDLVDSMNPATFLALACELEAQGDFSAAAQMVAKALYLDRGHEAALVLASRLAERRGDAAEAARLRLRALRAHLANEVARENSQEPTREGRAARPAENDRKS